MATRKPTAETREAFRRAVVLIESIRRAPPEALSTIIPMALRWADMPGRITRTAPELELLLECYHWHPPGSAGRVKAQNFICLAFTGAIRNQARRFATHALPEEDLFTYGVEVICTKLPHWRPWRTADTTLCLLPGLVKQALSQNMSVLAQTHGAPVSVTVYATRQVSKARKEGVRLGRSTADMLEAGGVPADTAKLLLGEARTVPVEDVHHLRDGSTSIEGRAIEADLRAKLPAALEVLTLEEREVMRLAFGLEGRPALPTRDIARRLGVTTARVEALHSEALRALHEELN